MQLVRTRTSEQSKLNVGQQILEDRTHHETTTSVADRQIRDELQLTKMKSKVGKFIKIKSKKPKMEHRDHGMLPSHNRRKR